MEIGKELQSNGIGMKWLNFPVQVKGLPIFCYPIYYDNVRNIQMYTDTGYNNTWKLTYDIEDKIEILK